MNDFGSGLIGNVNIATSKDGGMGVEYFAERIVERLMFISNNAPEPIRAQAQAYRERMATIVLEGLKSAIQSDRAYRKGL